MKTEMEKRKRDDDGGANGMRGKAREDEHGGGEVVAPPDEEVEEFFAILKRIQVALNYFRGRHGGDRRCTDRDLTATPWSPSFEPEDFGVKREPDRVEESPNADLDLNFRPGF